MWKHQYFSLVYLSPGGGKYFWQLNTNEKSESHSVVSKSLWPHGLQIQGILQARILEWRILQPFPSPGHLPNPGIKLRSLALQADSLPSEPPREVIPVRGNLESCPNHWCPRPCVGKIKAPQRLWVLIPRTCKCYLVREKQWGVVLADVI